MFLNPQSRAQRAREILTANLLRAKMLNKYRPAIRGELRRIADSAVSELVRPGGGDDEALLMIERTAKNLEAPLIGAFVGTGRNFGQLVLLPKKAVAELGTSFEQALTEWAVTESGKKIVRITDTLLSDVRGVLARGQEAGMGVIELSKAIQEKISSGLRAETIARTETHNASTFATDRAVREMGLAGALQKEWAWSGISRADHAAVDGERVGIDDSFLVGGEYMQRPGDGSARNVIKCGCFLFYHNERSN